MVAIGSSSEGAEPAGFPRGLAGTRGGSRGGSAGLVVILSLCSPVSTLQTVKPIVRLTRLRVLGSEALGLCHSGRGPAHPWFGKHCADQPSALTKGLDFQNVFKARFQDVRLGEPLTVSSPPIYFLLGTETLEERRTSLVS